jgi:hypothetical protein
MYADHTTDWHNAQPPIKIGMLLVFECRVATMSHWALLFLALLKVIVMAFITIMSLILPMRINPLTLMLHLMSSLRNVHPR